MDSSLDRFARTRGAALLGVVAMRRQGRIQSIVGGGLLGVGGVIALVPVVGLPAEVAWGALGPSIAGLVNLSLGIGFSAAARKHRSTLILSDEARDLLQALVTRAQVWQDGWRPARAPFRGPHAWPGYRALVAPPASAMDALERAAEAHNRVAATLGGASDERAQRLLAAADAGMGEALHQAAVQTDDAADIERTVAKLTELADLVERSTERSEPPSALRSNLESTLDEMRAENAARLELKG